MEFDAFTGGIEPGGLRSKDEIRILICYLLTSVSAPLSREDILSIMQENGFANYFEVTYFVPDEHKEGGSYEHVTGYLKKLDSIGHLMIVVDDNGTETVIDTRRIYDIDL